MRLLDSRFRRCVGLGWVVGLLALGVSGCAGDYVAHTRGVRASYEHSDYPRALSQLERVEKEGSKKDELLVLFDRGMILHTAGRYEESIAVLNQADTLSKQLDVVSVSEEAGVLLSNEREKAYRGEDFEKLMISVLQALNYAELGKDEDALVEARRVNERLQKMVAEEKKPYEQLAIARYLSGILYEDQGNWDDAYLDYAKALELEPRLSPALTEPILRLAKITGRDDSYDKLQKRFPGEAVTPLAPGEGQVVVIIEAGLSPEKTSDHYDHAGEIIEVPVYRNRGYHAPAHVQVDGGADELASTVTSIDRVAKIHLQDRVGRMVLKQLAGVAVKAGVATGVGAATHSRELGFLTFLLLNLANAPDLRSWLSLPAEFQIARFRVPAGHHAVSVTYAGQPVSYEVDVKPKRITLMVLRRY